MAGSYTKKEFGVGPEEQNLLKDANGAARIVGKGAEPVRLSPGWEGTGRPEDELNFKGVTMDRADLELNPAKDRLNVVFFVMLLHGIGALIPWNLFITVKEYFTEFKLSEEYTGQKIVTTNFHSDIGFATQIPNLLFNWVNVFVQFGGNLTTRIAWSLFVQGIVIIFTIILAMSDSSGWPGIFFWVTIVSIVILSTANGIYQNSVFGMAAKLPGKYIGAIILGTNISGTFTAVTSLLAKIMSSNARTAAIYYFITNLFVILACFDTYFALPINRFYRYHELVYEKEKNKNQLENNFRNVRPPYWKIFKQCAPQCFNVFMIFFVTLSLFPAVQSCIKISDANFVVPAKYYENVMCYWVFNITSMLGSLLASCYQWPSKKYIVIPILLRVLYMPLFLICNYMPDTLTTRTVPVLINNDWIYLVIALTMALTNGYFSSLAMMYCPTMVEPRYASTAGMFGAAFLITGIFTGLTLAMVMPIIVTTVKFG